MKLGNLPQEITTELAEEIGWHIGDGSMNFYKNKGKPRGFYQLRGHIEDDKPHYLERIKPIFRNLYGINISLREMPSTRVFGFQIWNDELVTFKKNLGLPLGIKVDVTIPEALLLDKKLIKSVIRGIFDTDGCIYLQKKYGKLYPRLEIQTISPKLADQLLRLFNQIGLRATKNSWQSNQGNRKIIYNISIRGIEMLHRFMKEIDPKNPKHIRKYLKFIDSQKLINSSNL